MSDEIHQLGKEEKISENDIVFDCPSCHKSLVVDVVAAGHALDCPNCKTNVTVPKIHKVVGLSEAPETQQLQSKPQWEQELISLEAALKEIRHQREEAGNFYKKHASEANRQQLRMEKLDAKIKELEDRKEKVKSSGQK
jgi:vacuolar-type H+-ATPase subunit I/STV1